MALKLTWQRRGGFQSKVESSKINLRQLKKSAIYNHGTEQSVATQLSARPLGGNNTQMKTKDTFGVSIRIMNIPQKHEELTAIFGVKQSIEHKIGDINPSNGKKWRNNIWFLRSPIMSTKSFNEHIKWLNKQISPHRKYISKLIKEGAKIDVFCTYSSDDNVCGFSIDSKLLEMFVKLGITIEVSLVCG